MFYGSEIFTMLFKFFFSIIKLNHGIFVVLYIDYMLMLFWREHGVIHKADIYSRNFIIE